MGDVPRTHAEILRLVIGFDDADLKANHAGIISASQRQKIIEEHRTNTSNMVLGCAFYVMIAGCAALSKPDHPEHWPLSLVFLPFILLVFWDSRRSARKINRALATNQAIRLSGVLKRQKNSRIVMDGKEFIVGTSPHMNFRDGEHYTLYYVPGIDHILSAEPTYDVEKEKRLSDESTHDKTLSSSADDASEDHTAR